MEVPFLQTPVSKCDTGTGAQFTVRSASSPSYSITRRPGVRRSRGFIEEVREGTEGDEERERRGTDPYTNGTNKERDGVSKYQDSTGGRSSVKGQCEEKEPLGHETSTKLNQNGTGDKTTTESGTDRSENPAFESRGRTEGRRYNLSSRSKSLDWGDEAKIPVQGTRADMLSTSRGGDFTKQLGGFDERRAEAVRNRSMTSTHTYSSAGQTNDVQDRSPVSHLSQTLVRVSRGNSLPSRMRSQSGPSSRFTEKASSLGPKGGQSIMERIEKLYGTAGGSKAEDNSKIRDFSTFATTADSLISSHRSYERGAGGTFPRGGIDLAESERKGTDSGDNLSEDFGKYSKLKSSLEITLNGGRRQAFYIDETDFAKVSSPEEASGKDMTANNTPTLLLSNSSDISTNVASSPVSDDQTPTNTPIHSPVYSPTAEPEKTSPIADRHDSTSAPKSLYPDSSLRPRPLATSSHSNLHDLVSSEVTTAQQRGRKPVLELDSWVAGLNSAIKVWSDDEDDEDDDESTQRDEDSNYDSDSGESSVTVTSNMSQSDNRSFCVSLSDLCSFAGVDYESDNDSDEWPSRGRRSASLSSDVSALSCVSVMPSEELDRLLEDVRSLGDNTLQDYDDVQVAVLHKEMGVGLGFSVAGGVDQSKPVTVHRVFHSGVASKEGSIMEGDQVLSINGTALSGYTHWEVLRVLRRAKARETGVVVLRRGGINDVFKSGVQTSTPGPTQTQITFDGQHMCVSLEKNSRDLGFSLEGGVGSSLGNRPLTVQKIFQGGPVDKVCPGDEVLEIEGVSVVGMRRLEAWTLIRKLPSGPVDLVLSRPLKHLET
ncbi:uncharacterized protein si:dkey-92i15.4 [Limanda limanda]|uniref:uncharacterized protein si:dkey-92i15.4 n=1 Tax=Limanda limanda TaxID=27771 RepID=UPI0029C89F67|nr:uncharacterized protein si:dkey-92i15.4 [Limanda limanda]